jgi:hypothetical protein
VAKWLTAIGGALVLLLLIVLKYEMGGDAVASPSAPVAPAPVAAKAPIEVAMPAPAPAPAPVKPAAPEPPKKLDPQSDAFFYKFDEVVPKRLTREAAACYEGHAHLANRNMRLKVSFKTQIANGEVTLHDVKVVDSSLGDQALENCFVRKISEAHWRDDSLPDWQQDDMIVIRPERGLKKYMKENLEYDGDGPEGPPLIKAGQEAPPSDSATKSESDDW